MSKGNPRIYVRLEPSIMAEICVRSSMAGVSAAEFVRMIVMEWLDAHK